MDGSSSCTQVPGSQVNAERTCSAHARRCGRTRPTAWPASGSRAAVISSISSKLTVAMRRAVGHEARVGGEHAGHVGVELAGVGLERVGQRDGGGVGAAAAEERDVAVGRHALGAADDRARARRRAPSRSRSGRTSRILALVWVVSVMNPAWLPVKLSAGTPRSCSAMHSRAVALRSPAVMSMSISRPGRTLDTSPARRSSSSVSLPMALTTTTTSSPRRWVRGDVVGDLADALGVGDGGAAELLDDEGHGPSRYRRPPIPVSAGALPGSDQSGGRGPGRGHERIVGHVDVGTLDQHAPRPQLRDAGRDVAADERRRAPCRSSRRSDRTRPLKSPRLDDRAGRSAAPARPGRRSAGPRGRARACGARPAGSHGPRLAEQHRHGHVVEVGQGSSSRGRMRLRKPALVGADGRRAPPAARPRSTSSSDSPGPGGWPQPLPDLGRANSASSSSMVRLPPTSWSSSTPSIMSLRGRSGTDRAPVLTCPDANEMDTAPVATAAPHGDRQARSARRHKAGQRSRRRRRPGRRGRSGTSAVLVTGGRSSVVAIVVVFAGCHSSPPATTATTPDSTTTDHDHDGPRRPSPLPAPGEAVNGETPCPPADGVAEPHDRLRPGAADVHRPGEDLHRDRRDHRGRHRRSSSTPANAPITVNNFVVLSRYHYYDGAALPPDRARLRQPAGDSRRARPRHRRARLHDPRRAAADPRRLRRRARRHGATAARHQRRQPVLLRDRDPDGACSGAGSYTVFGKVDRGPGRRRRRSTPSAAPTRPRPKSVTIDSVTITESLTLGR